MRTYKEVTIEHAGDFIEFTDGDKIGWIPKDSANSDYQEYLNPGEAKLIEAVDE
jgi:hypothetical protein